jgi:hypothetical protein
MTQRIKFTEAIEAARQALQRAGHDAPSVEALLAIHAGAPLIERAVRDRIAADIEALKVTNWGGFQLVRKAQVIAAIRGNR